MSDLVFPSMKNTALSDMTFTKLLRDEKLDATAHGFRSSFKVWASECAKVPNEVSEAALARSLGSKVVAAYFRTAFLAGRRPLMEDWSRHCLGSANRQAEESGQSEAAFFARLTSPAEQTVEQVRVMIEKLPDLAATVRKARIKSGLKHPVRAQITDHIGANGRRFNQTY